MAYALQRAAAQVTDTWSSVAIGGWSYAALRVMGEELDGTDPFELLADKLLADKLPAATSTMGDYTLVVAGMDFKEGPGFIVLASKGPAGELLLDSTCAIDPVLP